MRFILSCLVFSLISIATYHSNADVFSEYPKTVADYFYFDMSVANAEYYYHARKWGDSKEFPTARNQYLAKKIEDEYFATGKYREFAQKYNLKGSPKNIIFAKMFLSYGIDPLVGSTPLPYLVEQEYYGEPPAEDFANGDELIAFIRELEANDPESVFPFVLIWETILSPQQAIAIAKFYLALGVDVHQKKDDHHRYDTPQTNALISSFTEYRFDFVLSNGEISKGNIAFKDIPTPDPNPLPDYYELQPSADRAAYAYRKSTITYWLEEFIETGYPASMLDTHRLHYPRFMKEASVAEVTAMLNNPDAHKIPANINCPYKETCPLTPSVNMRDAMGRTPLHIAGEQGNKAVYDALIQIGADKSVKDFRGKLAGLK